MKRTMLMMLALLIAATSFAVGAKEAPVETTEIWFVSGGDPMLSPIWAESIARWQAEYPDAVIKWAPVNTADASAVSIDARIAAGLPMNIILEHNSRSLPFAKPRYDADGTERQYWAVDLSKYWDDLDDWLPGVLDPYWTDGELLAVPEPGWMVGMRINTSILDKTDYVLPAAEDWTIAEFLKMARAIKKADLPDVWPTIMFAENRSGDWMYQGWWASYGFKTLFTPGYTGSDIRNAQGLAVMTLWHDMWQEGLIPPDSAMLNDDHMIGWRDGGLLAAAGDRAGDKNAMKYQQSLIDQEIIKEPYKTVFYPFPKAPGVTTVPVIVGNQCTVVFDAQDERINKIAARLAWHLNSGAQQQTWATAPARYFALRKSVTYPATDREDNPWYYEAMAIIQDNGVLDVGSTLPEYGDIRGALFPVLQKLFSGKLTPAEALEEYAAALDVILAK